MAWINTISFERASGKLKNIYKRVTGPRNNVDNVLQIHSLRPHTLVGHMTLYKSVLHHAGNTLPKWYLEALGVYVSHLNNCAYCVDHHSEGFKRALNHQDRAHVFFESLEQERLHDFFDGKYLEGISYALSLTCSPSKVTSQDIDRLRNVGFTDGEILEINQVVSYFNYVNRSVLGLGVSSKGDIIGLSPKESDDPENWSHS